MGLFMSFMGRGMSPAQMLNLATDSLYKQFTREKINNFEDFHIAILDIFNTLNSALPGKHYDMPPWKEVQECFVQWTSATSELAKMDVFVNFMKRNVTLGKPDNTTIITGLVTPPAAMAAKRAGENVGTLSLIKVIPDVVFVPSFTVLALVSVKITKKIFRANTADSNHE